MLTAVLTSKGQTTIPKPIRDFLHLHAGDRIDFFMEKEGSVVIRPATLDVGHLKGLLKRPHGKKLSVEQMNEIIAQSADSEKK